MGARMHCLLLGMLAAYFLAAGTTHAAEQTAPTWPQQFSLYAGEKAEYAFPVTQAGEITANATWQGVGLIVSLLDPSGKPVNAPVQKGSPAKVSHTVTAADLQKGVYWTVFVIAPPAPKPSQKPVATGQVTVQSPLADARKIAPQFQSLLARRNAALKLDNDRLLVGPNANPANNSATGQNTIVGPNSRPVEGATAGQRTAIGPNFSPANSSVAGQKGVIGPNFQPALPDFNKARLDRIKLLETQLTTRMKQNTQQQAKMMQSGATTSGRGVIANTAVKAPSLDRKVTSIPPSAVSALEPWISSVTPGIGCPNQRVMVEARNLDANINSNEAWFVIGPNFSVQGRVTSVTSTSDGLRFEVQVPSAGGITQGFDGQIWLKVKSNGKITNRVPFRFEPVAFATVTSVSPTSVGPGEQIVINGANFTAQDQVHFIMPQGGDMVVQSRLQNAGQLIATAPAYTSRTAQNAHVYVARQCGSIAINSPLVSISLRPTSPSIASIDRAEGGPGEPILITGAGFRQPVEVHCIINPGRDEKATGVQVVGDTQILAYIPDFSGVAATYNGQIYVKSGTEMSEFKAFRYVPATEYVTVNSNDFNYPDQIRCDKREEYDNCQVYTWNGKYGGFHHSGIVSGHRGDDEFLFNTYLRNNWVVDSIVFDKHVYSGESDAYVSDYKPGTSHMYVKVHWWVTPVTDSASYNFTYIIRGPRGMPCK